MKRSIFRPILFGVLFGAAAYFMPFFLLKGIMFLLIIGFIFRMVWWRGYLWGSHGRYQMVMADRIRSMSEEEYNALKDRMGNWHMHGCGGYRGRWSRHNCGWDESCNWDDKAEAKKESDNTDSGKTNI